MDPTAKRVLQHAKIARLATVSVNGLPNLTPLWFVFDGARLSMATREASVAARNIRSNPEVAVLVEYKNQRVLRIRGTAEFTRDPRTNRRMIFGAALKYHLSLGGLLNFVSSLGSLPNRIRYYGERAGESGVIVVTPQTI